MKQVINKQGEAKYKIKRSEFISYALYIENQATLNNFLKTQKGRHTTARHFCWAYRLDQSKVIIENYSDAGEPSGSAGIPILNTLKSAKIVNGAIIVIRYFGGIKLGKRGLIDAYQTAAKMAIANSDIQVWEPKLIIKLSADINYFGNITGIIQKYNGSIVADQSGEKMELKIELIEKVFKKFTKNFNEVTHNSGTIKKQSEHDQTKEVRK